MKTTYTINLNLDDEKFEGLFAQGHGDSEFDDEPLLPFTNTKSDYNEIGINLVPGSAGLMIFLNEFGTINEVIDKNKKDI